LVTLNAGYDERGLLGFAFHPNFTSNGRFFVFYSAPPRAGGPQPGTPWNNTIHVSEFKAAAGAAQVDLSTEKVLLEIDHPQSNHNGGTLAFGPDGYLYISIGDGGNKDDVAPGHVDDWYKVNGGGNGQDVQQNLLGNILRVDIDQPGGGHDYGIPADNPFVSGPGLDEIYAYGFRNPFRFSFDRGGDHRLFAGDAGQSLYEEVDVVTKGGNYGWNVKEGTHCFSTADDLKEPGSCPSVDSAGNPLIDPVIELVNTANPKGGGITIAVIGGYVYRGTAVGSLAGKYIFGSLSGDGSAPAGKLYQATPQGPGLWPFTALSLKTFPDNIGQWIKGFGEDAGGEVYVMTSSNLGPSGTTGKLYKLTQ